MVAVATKKSEPVKPPAPARTPEFVYTITPEWRKAVKDRLAKSGRGAHARLANEIGCSAGSLTDMLKDTSEHSSYVAAINAYFGWDPPAPPAISSDAGEAQYLVDGMGDAGRDLMRELKRMGKDEAKATIEGLLAIIRARRPSD